MVALLFWGLCFAMLAVAAGLNITVPDLVVANTTIVTTWERSAADPEKWDLHIASNLTDYKIMSPGVNSAAKFSGVTNITLTTPGKFWLVATWVGTGPPAVGTSNRFQVLVPGSTPAPNAKSSALVISDITTSTQPTTATPTVIPSPPRKVKTVPTAKTVGAIVTAIIGLFLLSLGLWFWRRDRTPRILIEPMITDKTEAHREENHTHGYLEVVGPMEFALRADIVTPPARKRAHAARHTNATDGPSGPPPNGEPLTVGETRVRVYQRAVDAGPVITSGESDESDAEMLPPEYEQVFEDNRGGASTIADRVDHTSQTSKERS